MEGACRGSEVTVDSEVETSPELLAIQKELAALKQRRMQLEEQRKRLLGSCKSTPLANDAYNSSACSRKEESGKYVIHQKHPSLSRAYSGRHDDHSILSLTSPIPSEATRLKTLKKNVYREMKESMQKGWERDSSLVMGTFLTGDIPRSCTFGRERRFIPIADQKGDYFLSNDLEILGKCKNQLETRVTASRRGERGMNVSNHWNDLHCSGSPGPGAYTPRYSKLGKPSILSQR